MALDAASTDEAWARIKHWLSDVIARPDPRLGRAGSLCPFIRRSLRAEAVLHRIEHVAAGVSPAELVPVVLRHVAAFDDQPWPNAPVELRALVISFPELTTDTAEILDEVHPLAKDAAVAAGFMLAQFHPAGTVPSVRHPAIAAGTGPVPVIVIRRMAEHDILFLDQNQAWVNAYRRRFGDRALRSAHSDAFLRAALQRALTGTTTAEAAE